MSNLNNQNFVKCMINFLIMYIILFRSPIIEPYRNIGLLAVVLICAYIILINLKNQIELSFSANEILLIFFIGYMLFSITWSVYRYAVMKEVLIVLLCSIIGYLVTRTLSFKQFLNQLFFSYSIVILISILTVIFFPENGLDSHGDWKGIFAQKNVFAINISFYCIILTIYLLDSKKNSYRLFYFLLLLFSVFSLLQTSSSTALIVTVISMYFIFTLIILIILPIHSLLKNCILVFSSLITCTIIYMSVLYLQDIFSLLGKDSTLTGRSYIWEMALQGFLEHPIIGSGIQSFWYNYKLGINNYYLPWGQPVWHAHNALIDLLLQYGVIGLILFITLYIRNIAVALKIVKTRDIKLLFSLLFLFFLILINLTESYLFAIEINFFIIFICITGYLSRDLKYQSKLYNYNS